MSGPAGLGPRLGAADWAIVAVVALAWLVTTFFFQQYVRLVLFYRYYKMAMTSRDWVPGVVVGAASAVLAWGLWTLLHSGAA